MKKTLFLFALLFLIFRLHAQEKEDITYIDPKAPLYLIVKGNILQDSIKSFVADLLKKEKYSLLEESDYSLRLKKYFEDKFKPLYEKNDPNIVLSDNGKIIFNKLVIEYSLHIGDSRINKINSFTWQIFPTPSNIERYRYRKMDADGEFMKSHTVFEVIERVLETITKEQEIKK
jgi:hypothetical protein